MRDKAFSAWDFSPSQVRFYLQKHPVVDLQHFFVARIEIVKEGQQLGLVAWANVKTKEYEQVLPDGTVNRGTFDTFRVKTRG